MGHGEIAEASRQRGMLVGKNRVSDSTGDFV
jgi:hypothetical protein